MYGETPSICGLTLDTRGLSPRVRGNLAALTADSTVCGSIPACTGKPEASMVVLKLVGVYPRVYGETEAMTLIETGAMGLSPRVRGNRPNRSIILER